METRVIRFWEDLQHYGINALTGESCAYAMRLLCDVNEDGARLLRQYFGLPHDAALAANWNAQVNGKPAIGSIMLAREEYAPLARFCLFQEFPYILTWGDYDYLGMGTLPEDVGTARVLRNPANPAASIGGRNVHQMSGRSE